MEEQKNNMIGLTRILIILFAGTNILYTLGKGDNILQIICIAGVMVIAVIISLTTWKNKSGNQMKQTIIQILYCVITVLIAFVLSRFVGNIIASVLIIAITVLYICLPK